MKYAVLDLPREWNAFENYGNRLASAAEHGALLRCARERSTLVEIRIAEGVSALAIRKVVYAGGTLQVIRRETYWSPGA